MAHELLAAARTVNGPSSDPMTAVVIVRPWRHACACAGDQGSLTLHPQRAQLAHTHPVSPCTDLCFVDFCFSSTANEGLGQLSSPHPR